MNQLPMCPCCGEDGLRIVDYILDNGQWHYRVECACCGVEFHHEKFYGINQVEKFLEDCDAICENLADSSMRFECSVCGCEVNGGDELGHNSSKGAFNYCPNCKAEVVQ